MGMFLTGPQAAAGPSYRGRWAVLSATISFIIFTGPNRQVRYDISIYLTWLIPSLFPPSASLSPWLSMMKSGSVPWCAWARLSKWNGSGWNLFDWFRIGIPSRVGAAFLIEEKGGLLSGMAPVIPNRSKVYFQGWRHAFLIEVRGVYFQECRQIPNWGKGGLHSGMAPFITYWSKESGLLSGVAPRISSRGKGG